MRKSIVVVISLFLFSSAVFASPLTDMTLSVPLPIEAGTPLNVDDRPLPFEPIDVKTATPEEIMNAFSHLSSIPKKIPSKTWRECIRKIWEVDPLNCPNCGGEMRIVSFITEASVIRQILEHLNLWEQKLSRDPREWGQLYEDSAVVREPVDDGWKYSDEYSPTSCIA